jgi:cytochrome c oxidase subunit II
LRHDATIELQGQDRMAPFSTMFRKAAGAGCVLAASLGIAAAKEEAVVGMAVDGQYGFITSGSEMSRKLVAFHDVFLLPIIVVISLFVLGLLAYVVVRFNERANPKPSRVTHNTTIEIAWTVVPILILVAIAIPSFRLLSEQVRIPAVTEAKNEAGEVIKDAAGNPQMAMLLGGRTDMDWSRPISRVINLKVTGNAAWNWTFNYAEDSGGLQFTSVMLKDNEITDKVKQPRLLAVDNEVVVPLNALVRLTVTSDAVLHSYGMPSFGLKTDAVPGRLNETWFRPEKVGVYYGQCSELCGKDHAFMPSVIRVVTPAQFDLWVKAAKEKQDATGAGPGSAEAYMEASLKELQVASAQ